MMSDRVSGVACCIHISTCSSHFKKRDLLSLSKGLLKSEEADLLLSKVRCETNMTVCSYITISHRESLAHSAVRKVDVCGGGCIYRMSRRLSEVCIH